MVVLGTPVEKEDWIGCILADKPRDGRWVGIVFKGEGQDVRDWIEVTEDLFPVDLEPDFSIGDHVGEQLRGRGEERRELSSGRRAPKTETLCNRLWRSPNRDERNPALGELFEQGRLHAHLDRRDGAGVLPDDLLLDLAVEGLEDDVTTRQFGTCRRTWRGSGP